MAAQTKVMGFLPNDQPPFGQLVLLALQHILTMFPATVLCALLMHFDVSVVLDNHRFRNNCRSTRRKIRNGQVHPPVLWIQLFLYCCRSHGC